MTKKSLNASLVAASPPPTSESAAVEVVDDLDRILSLPSRPPLDCRFDREVGRYASPRARALVEVVTARLGRGARVSCDCRPRVVRALPGGKISIARVIPDGLPPEPPRVVSIASFVADNQAHAEEIAAAEGVARLRAGEDVALPAGDGGDGHACIETLNAIQAWSLHEIPREAGGIGFCGVGSGKSLVHILLPIALGDECELAVLLIEPNQRRHYASQYRRARSHFRVPSIVFDEDGVSPYYVPGAPTIHILPYSKLGNPKYPDELDRLNPNVILADEAHRLTGQVNSTGRLRVRRYVERKIKERLARIAEGLPVKRRAVYVVPMSGTLEDKSIEDTRSVSAHALGTQSPLPLSEAEAQRWSAVFDPVRTPDRKSRTARRLQVAFAGRAWSEGDVVDMLAEGPEKAIREGFRKRRSETPGVISASAEAVGATIYFRERKAPRMPEVVAAALKKVREEGIRPDGEVIIGDSDNNVEAMQKIIAKQVGIGLYLYWAFPKVPCTCQGKEPRCEGCLLIDEWFARRKTYGREARPRLIDALPHLDSPKLLKNAATRAKEDESAPAGLDVYCVDCRQAWPCGKSTHLPAWRSRSFAAWSEVENKVPHEQRVRWIGSDLPEAEDPATHPGYFLARDAAARAKEEPIVLWSQTVAFGQTVARLAGIPYHGGGSESEDLIRAETGGRSIVASLKAHGKGLDHLQNYYDSQILMEMVSSNRVMEQLLGRLLRRGQRSDRVLTEYYAHTLEFREALRKVKVRAEFNQATQGNPALILSAVFE